MWRILEFFELFAMFSRCITKQPKLEVSTWNSSLVKSAQNLKVRINQAARQSKDLQHTTQNKVVVPPWVPICGGCFKWMPLPGQSFVPTCGVATPSGDALELFNFVWPHHVSLNLGLCKTHKRSYLNMIEDSMCRFHKEKFNSTPELIFSADSLCVAVQFFGVIAHKCSHV